MLFSYSRADGSVLRYDIPASEVRARDPLVAEEITAPAITAAGDAWAVVDSDDGDVWLRGADAAVSTPTTGAVVAGQPDAEGTRSISPTRPRWCGCPSTAPSHHRGRRRRHGARHARAADRARRRGLRRLASAGRQGGVLWSSRAGRSAARLRRGGLPDQRRPAFVASDDAIILNETRTGWVWTVPDGELVASSQNWSLDDRTDPDAAQSEEQLSVVIDPEPPVADPDAFGVRAGSLVTLPVLMNDHDPNEDVLSIDPASVTGLDPEFGTVSITDDGQRLTVRSRRGRRARRPSRTPSPTARPRAASSPRRRRSPSPFRRRMPPRSGAGSRDASFRGRRRRWPAAAP